MELAAGILLIALVGWSGMLAWLVVQQAVNGSRYVQWSADPFVLLGELALAGCLVVVAIAVIVLVGRRFRAGTAAPADTAAWIGLGFLAVGAIAIAVGWLGLRVPTTPGYDVLSRGEPMFIIYGLATAAFGVLLTVIAGGASLLRPRPADDGGALTRARPAISWTAPDAPTWKVLRCGLLHGAAPGDLVVVGVEPGSVIVARRLDLGVQRLATYPAGVRLRKAEGDAYLLSYGPSDIALLTPVDADPAALVAALDAAAR